MSGKKVPYSFLMNAEPIHLQTINFCILRKILGMIRNNRKNETNKLSFKERYRQFSDDKLMTILKNRLNYQKEAVDCAVKEAISRGLIKNEHDLETPQPELKFKLFPPFIDSEVSSGFWSSILRILYIIGIFPIIFGILALAENKILPAIIGIVAGTIWIVLTFLLKKQKKAKWAYLQVLIALFISIGGIYYYDFFNRSHTFVDYLVAMIILTLAFLTPIFAGRLCSLKN